MGHVANSVETEQILALNNTWSSFIQTRGSIPVFWSQPTSNLKYNPRTQITHSAAETEKAFRAHFDRQLRIYSRQLVVNLLDEKGNELLLTKLFTHYLQRVYGKNPQIEYVGFDFHENCKNDQYENVNLLLKKVEDRLSLIGFTRVSNGHVELVQYGTVRTNCLDCLDRTNLVQRTFASYSLQRQLSSFGIDSLGDDGIIERAFNEAWGDNGDAVSFQYAGTGALKSDFTRTGKRNTKGKLKDGVNALSRYYINNFQDHIRQIAIDLVLGNQRVETIDMTSIEEITQESKKEELECDQDDMISIQSEFDYGQ